MKQHGLTLVELLMVLIISAILLGIGVPGYAHLVKQTRLAGLTNDLVSTLNLARSEAIKRGMRVTLCKSATTANDSPGCDSGANWQDGWLVYLDDGVYGTLDSADQVMYVHQPVAHGGNIIPTNFTTYISYLPSGASRGPKNLGNGTFNLCLDGIQRKVIVNNTGRIRLENGKC